MNTPELEKLSEDYLRTLCCTIPERCVGSEGNRQATSFFRDEISSLGWNTREVEFDAIDWHDGGARLTAGGKEFEALASPYSLGGAFVGELTAVSSIGELEKINARSKILILHGDIAKEQLMPKNFVFYNPDEHKRIIALLEEKNPLAIIGITGRSVYTSGGVYPFPLLEDGDFDIPSIYMKDVEGEKLLPYTGTKASIISDSKRIHGKGYNIIALKGKNPAERITVSAHIDAKKGTTGAIDNATGVIVLLLLARLMKDYNGESTIEIAAFNGEDYYAAPGQMNYLFANKDKFSEVKLNINIDGAGYKEGGTALSFFDLPEHIHKAAENVIKTYPDINEGIQWVQGDHSMFIQNGCPAIAVSSQWFLDNIGTQDITHTPKDNISIVECRRIVEIAEALKMLITEIV